MRIQNIDREWKFYRGMADIYGSYSGNETETVVNLPHDYMIENDVLEDAPAGSASGFYNAGIAYYKKTVNIPSDWVGEQVFLRFDGVMMNATVDINGCKAELHHYGYTPFCVDITPYIYYGQDNNVLVLVNPSMQPNSRWYSGAGIFRSVEMIHVPPVHIVNDGIFGYTKKILYGNGGKAATAFLNTEVSVRNTTVADHMAEIEVSLVRDETNETVLTRRAKIQIDAGSVETAYIAMTVDAPALWDIDTPFLYRLTAKVTDIGVFKTRFMESEEKISDCDSTLFGIRTVTADVRGGLQINGKTVKLRGGCVHHDNGLLGAVSLYDAEVRRIQKMKEVGFNAIRTTHNPPSKILMEVCDRLGMYVFAEAFDTWGIGKLPGDYNQFFMADWEKDLEAFMVRDRNHPSIIIWSTGNEIPERGGLNHGYTLATKIAKKAKTIDSSRLISNGICSYWSGLDDVLMAESLEKMVEHMKEGALSLQNADGGKADTSWEKMSEAFMNGLDVVGYNYMEDKYFIDHEMYPERIILGSENYPKEIGKRWPMVERTPYVIGDFTWTAIDYIGEAGIGKSFFIEPDDPRLKKGLLVFDSSASQFPYRLANDADIDINGVILPQGHYRSVVFGSFDTHVFSYEPANFGKKELLSEWGFTACEKNWNWIGDEGKDISVIVFSRAEEVEIILNGRTVGRKKQGESLGTENIPLTFVFNLKYEPGELIAVSYMNGAEVSRDSIATVGEPVSLKVSLDKNVMEADGHSLIYAEIEVTDAQDQLVPNAEIRLSASCDGAAKLIGFGSGNPITIENYVSGKFTTYKGRCCAILRSGYEAGEALLTVNGDGLGSRSITVKVNRTVMNDLDKIHVK